MAEDLSAKSAQLAVETKSFPLYEIIDGTEYRITHEPKGLPVDEYVRDPGPLPPFHPRRHPPLAAGSGRGVGLLKGMVKGCKA